MTKKLFILASTVFLSITLFAQITEGGKPYSQRFPLSKNIASVKLDKVSEQWKQNAADEFNRFGTVEKVAKNIATNFSPTNSGTWENLPNGDRVWRLQITAEDAIAVNPLFSNFYLPKGSKLFIYRPDYKQILGAYTDANNHNSKQFSTELIAGSTMILEYYEPSYQKGEGSFTLENVGSFFKDVNLNPIFNNGFDDSDPCQININCSPVGDDWQDEKRGVARILVVSPTGQGWCTGSLVNNTAQDCKKYFLTALHCGDDATTQNFNNWIFYFNYEFIGCQNSSTQPTTSNTVNGATVISKANALNSTSSDFLLLELNATIPSSYNVYYNGWNIATSTSGGGVGIHHPAGDVKKISTFTATPSNVGVSFSGSGYTVNPSGTTHWSFAWSANANGHGVTEGGSSGSPMFNNSGEIIGTLSGGGSYCSSPNSSDQYGKMSYHWQSNGTTNPNTNNRKLKPWLDPTNSGVTSLTGTYAPCAPIASNDAGIFSIAEPSGTICGASISPIVELKNYGTSNLTSVAIKYQVNNGALYTYNWTGNLAQNATTLVTLNAIATPTGNNTFTAYTESPNNSTDSNTSNDSKTVSFVRAPTNSLPLSQNFEGNTFPPTGFFLSNADNNRTWSHAAVGFGTGNKSMYMDNWDYNGVGQLDWFLTPTYDFSTVTNATLTYDLAYAYYDQTNGNNVSYDTLGIAVSTDCGNSFYWLWKQGGTQLATAGGLGIEFVPTSSNWLNKSLDLSMFDNETSVQFAFISINGYGNNLYVDNININSVISNVPVAAFTSNKTSVCPNTAISFTDQSTNTPTSWSWSFAGATPSTSSQKNPTVTYNNPGTYTVTLIATNADGSDSETKLNYITVNAKPTLNFSNTPVSCRNGNNGSATVTATGNGGFTYSWSGGGTSATKNNLSAGTYTCTVTDANLCTATGSTTVTQPNTALSLNLNPTNVTCFNGTNGAITAVASGGSSAYTYAWSGTANTSATRNNLSAGTYTCTVTDASGCSVSKSVTLTQPSEIIVNTTVSSAYCNNANGSVSATASGGVGPYTYSFPNGSTNLSPGTYYCTVTDAKSCSKTVPFTIGNINETFAANVTSMPSQCSGNTGTAAVSIVGGLTGYSFAWDNGQTTPTANNLSFGAHTVTITNAHGCVQTSSFNVLNENAPTVNVQTSDVLCTGFANGSAQVNISGGTPSYSIVWSSSNNTGNTENNLSVGNYTVTVLDAASCATTVNFNIIEPDPIVISFNKEDEHCDSKDGQIIASATGGKPSYLYSWNSGINGNALINQDAGTYTVTVTDANNCSVQSSTSIQNIAAPSISNIIVTDVSCANAGNGSILVSLSGGTGNLSSIWSNGATTKDLLNVSSGNYTLIVTDAENCVSDTTISILELDPLKITLTIIDNSPAATSTISANASGGSQIYSFAWSNGQNTQTITNLAPGAYTLVVTDSENCSIDTTVNIGKVSIQNQEWIESVSLYPNPTTHSIELNINLKKTEDIHLSILNTLGQKVYENQLLNIQNSIQNINTSIYAEGVYYLKLESANAREIIKFVKVK